jgi:hypothetical protein
MDGDSCPRCGYNPSKKVYLKNHFKRERQCKPYIQDVNLSLLYKNYFCDEYEENERNHMCEYCEKKFVYSQGKSKHKKTCIKKKDFDNLNQLVLFQQKEIELLKANTNVTTQIIPQQNLNNSNNQIIDNSNNQMTDNSTNNFKNIQIININAFGKENMNYITESFDYKNFMTQCINNQGTGLCEFLLKKHFSEEHTENHNIRKMNKKDMFIDCYDGKKWHPKIANDFLYKLFMKLETDFSAFMDTLKKQETSMRKASLDAFMRKVGAPLEWNISNEYYDFDEDINEERSEKMKKNLYGLACEYIYRQSLEVFKM